MKITARSFFYASFAIPSLLVLTLTFLFNCPLYSEETQFSNSSEQSSEFTLRIKKNNFLGNLSHKPGLNEIHFSNSLTQNSEAPANQQELNEMRNESQELQREENRKMREDYKLKKNIHNLLGYATLGLAIATGITAPDDDDDDDDDDGPNSLQSEEDEDDEGYGIHDELAYATVVAAAATISLGFISLSDDIYWTGSWEKENYHALFGTLGAGLILGAVQAAPGGSHSGLGIAGGIVMGLSIAVLW